MDLDLFLDLYLPPCHAIYIFTRKNGEHLNPEFLEVNPAGKVPALRDGDFLLAESVAILLYLSRKYQMEARRYLPKLQARARVDECWPGSTRPSSSPPPTATCPVDAVQVEQLLGKLTPALGHLDQELLAARPFLAPGQVSLEDLMAFTELMQPAAVGCNLFRDWPRLAAWQAHVEAALGPELVQEAHRCVLQPQETQGDPQMAQKLAQQVKEQLR
ncbi:glutathione S-transferase theta-1-like [Budorcas taxicolor]|uniref:glutathione S-transferase theta-1-like n=1 Tax=Budorcas taxicolor TaxID=37181 RepID=UPI002284D486|nr:glutathione S-transferase theta-1-like [Budorcas taxicolor]